METPAQPRTSAPATAARIYDYLLGGIHYFPADQDAAKNLIAQIPAAPLIARANRATLRRMVTYLVAHGVHQFLDIGSGMPTQSNVHEVAQRLAPDSRVVYVDIDPVAVAESQQILDGNAHATAILGDLRSPQAILDHPQVRQLLDFSSPVALLMMGLLHFLADDQQTTASVTHLTEPLPDGSYLAITHAAAEGVATTGAHDDSYQILDNLYRRQTATVGGVRDREQLTGIFAHAGAALVDPGLVWMTEWQPAPDDPQDFADDPRRCGWWAGLGRINR